MLKYVMSFISDTVVIVKSIRCNIKEVLLDKSCISYVIIKCHEL